MTEIKPIAMPGTHQNFLKYFNNFSHDKSLKILDVGAGHGAFTKILYNMAFNISASLVLRLSVPVMVDVI